MASRPPWYLDEEGTWTEQDQRDWKDFQHKDARDHSNALSDLLKNRIVQVAFFLRFAIRDEMSIVVPAAITLLYICNEGRFVHQIACKHPTIASYVPAFTLAVLCLGQLLNALLQTTESLQIVWFLGPRAIWNLVVFCTTTFRTNLYICAPIEVLSWVTFQSITGLVAAPSAWLGAFILMLRLRMMASHESLRWRQFRTQRQLERARLTLDATQATLHGMLSTFWDASLTCNMDGEILTSTPQVDLLLGNGQNLIGANLIAFFDNSGDVTRLQFFLQTTLSQVAMQASTLQCTLRPRTCGLTPASTSKEFVFYAMKLPHGSTFHGFDSGVQIDRIFVGIRSLEESSPLPDATDTMATAIARIARRDEPLISAHISGAPGDTASFDITSMDNESLQRENVRVLRHSPSQTRLNESNDCTSLVYSGGAESTQSGRNIKSSPLELAKINAWVQTISVERPSTENKGIQTLYFAPHGLPKPEHPICWTSSETMPSRSRRLTRKSSRLFIRKRSGNPPERINLGTSECAISKFQKTPSSTVVDIIKQALFQMNLEGTGCCFFHITLAAMLRIMKDHFHGECVHFRDAAWQCAHCGAINMEYDDDIKENIADTYCEVCYQDQKCKELYSSSESFSADRSTSQDYLLAQEYSSDGETWEACD